MCQVVKEKDAVRNEASRALRCAVVALQIKDYESASACATRGLRLVTALQNKDDDDGVNTRTK